MLLGPDGDVSSQLVRLVVQNTPESNIRMKEVLETTQTSSHIALVPPVHVAVRTGNVEAFKLLLSKSSPEQAKKILNTQMEYTSDSTMPLFLAAAINGNVTMVKLLLDYGANPNAKIQGVDVTILCFICFNKFREDPGRYTQVITLLLENGVDLSVPSKYNNGAFSSSYLPLHFCAELAKVAPGLARRIVDNSPPACYDLPAVVRFGTCFSQDAVGTPLSLAIQRALIIAEACEMFRHAPNDHFSQVHNPFREEHRNLSENFCRRLLQSVALPLLSYGAALRPDPFHGPDESFQICRIAFADDFLSSVLYPHLEKPQGHFLRFVIAARQSSGMNISALSLRQSNVPLFANYFATQFQQLLEVLKQLFPLSLQDICRISILRSMPRGPTREKAISDLGLPTSLAAFLQFKEFSLPN